MYEATIEVKFDAAHRLLNYTGKCLRLHGHSYVAIVCVSSWELTDAGFVIDFGDLKRIVKGWIDSNWDHAAILNKRDSLVAALSRIAQDWVDKALASGNSISCEGAGIFVMNDDPTAERMARFLFDIVRNLCDNSETLTVKYVTIKETATAWATYKPRR